MLKVYGDASPKELPQIEIGGHCPVCDTTSRFELAGAPDYEKAKWLDAKEIVAGYLCNSCMGAIPVKWIVMDWAHYTPVVIAPEMVLSSRIPYDFEHIPSTIRDEIEEALTCLSVSAFNAFAALCRRTVQAICEDIGASGSTKVKKQIEEMVQVGDLDDELEGLAKEVMLTGHDGAHPHLPKVDHARAEILLSLLQDLTYQIYTRPGKVREASKLREVAQKGSRE